MPELIWFDPISKDKHVTRPDVNGDVFWPNRPYSTITGKPLVLIEVRGLMLDATEALMKEFG